MKDLATRRVSTRVYTPRMFACTDCRQRLSIIYYAAGGRCFDCLIPVPSRDNPRPKPIDPKPDARENKAFQAKVTRVLSTLSRRQRQVFALYYSGDGFKQREVAEQLNVSQQAVARIVARIAGKFEAAGIPNPLCPDPE